MQLNVENIKKLIVKIGFTPQNGKNNVYYKAYLSHSGYMICVDFNTEKIEYFTQDAPKDGRISIGDGTTSNFSHAENFVVLECIDRLLEKGYAPACIELEKTYPSGHGHSGRLDILVKTPDGQAFLMIECKTWGKEYEKEQKKMLTDGGQLFTYYKHAVAAKHLCLYSSHLTKSTVDYANSIVDVQKEWAALSEVKDIYEHWNKTFKNNGIFESYASPYNIVHKRLTYGDLENMREEDSGKIFNQIMEILRHNGISDKPNAFNKLLNLFVCKIIDEDKNENDELEFQCWDGLTDEKLQMTLNDLYKNGMWRFLNIEIIDHSMDEVNEKLDGISNAAHRAALMDIISDLRLKKSPNFAFVEVLDDKTFRLNAKVVREIVELLQGYRFRYEQKHEFLGNFFELLLNTSMKQEAGQFFTPVPITKFIISSLPLKAFVQDRIDKKSNEPLPTVIDYACGSGHFLTEFMSQLQDVVENVDIQNASPSIKKRFASWRDSVKFSWAEEFVYGIDFDNRLVKTTKVSAFFNGDGEANIVWGNGLDNFERSSEYRGKLKRTLPGSTKDNGQFDMLISNPPYSVQSFRRMLKDGADTFELYNGLTDNSSEIECLFVERAKQLLKVGGWAGIILPSSMLSNGGIYARSRDIIFKYFNIKSIVELGSGTFMKTGTNTVILFLERRHDSEHENIAQAIDAFFTNKRDVTVLGIENAFSKFVANVYNDLSFENYVSFVSGNASEAMKAHDLWKAYYNEYGDDIYTKALDLEREKVLYFLLTYNQTIVLVKSGQKQEAKAFLGYEFSERRGQEGIRRLPSGTMLFDKNGGVNNRQKVNSYIYNAFLGLPPLEIDEAVSKHISYGRLSDFIEYGTNKFLKRVNISKEPKVQTQWPQVPLNAVLETLEAGSRPTGGVAHNTDGVISVGGEHIGLDGKIKLKSLKYVPADFYQNSSKGKVLLNDILVCKDGALTGKVCIISGELPYKQMMVNEHVFILRANKYMLQHYLFEFLFSEQGQKILKANITGQAQGGLNSANLRNIKIPLPPIDIQQKIVSECEVIAKEIEQTKTNVFNLQFGIKTKFLDMFGDQVKNELNWERGTIRDIVAEVKYGTSKPANSGGKYPYLRMNNITYDGRLDTSDLKYIDMPTDEIEKYIVRKGDVLFNRTNSPELVGKTCVFDREESMVIAGYIIRVRLNERAIPEYLSAVLNSDYGKSTLFALCKKSVNQANINAQELQNIQILIPPVELQTQFSDFVRQANESELELVEKLKVLDRKYKSILDKYL